MLKKATLIVVLFVLFSELSYAQWVNQGAWPVNPPTDALYKTGQNHAMTVAPDGRIWAGRYANVANFTPPGGTKPFTKSVYLLYVFNEDGTQAPFSPIFEVMGDTMYSTTQRGMKTNIDGNIILATGGPAMYIIDYKTGKGLKKVALPSTNGPNGPCVAADGTIFIGTVFSGQRPVEMYDQNLQLKGTAIPVAPGFSRSFEVSKDGNTIYWAGYTTFKVYVYNRPDEFSNFSIKDSIMNGACVETFTWRPGTNQLWMSGGSANDVPKPPFTKGTWYAYDVVQKKVVDSLKWKYMPTVPPATPDQERPRALAFSKDGKTAYLGSFAVGAADFIQKAVLGGSDVKKLEEMPTQFELSQNYPNPFNPTTTIKFSMPVEGMVSLKVYNVVGEEVETLLDAYKGAGSYEVSFDASKLSSGVYMYTLRTEKMSFTKKMILVK